MYRPMRGAVAAASAVAALTLGAGLSACGDSAVETVGASPGENADEHEHEHALFDVSDGDAVPSIEIDVEPDPVSGANVHIDVTDFDVVPEHASTEPVAGEGHFHVYVDGHKVARFYNRSIHLPMTEGDHVVKVELSANDHSTYAVDGVPIADEVDITIPAQADQHEHHDPVEAVDPVPLIELSVTQDPKSGWNVHAATENLVFAPRSAGADHVDGEGHLHLYVDGQKVARLYGEWWHLEPLTAGEHEISVEATANDHRPYMVDGRPIISSTTIEVTADQAAAPPLEEADTVIEIAVVDGSVQRDDTRFVVEQGSTIGLVVTTDAPDRVHVHGYEILAMVEPDDPVDIVFTADSAGVFEVELEDSGLFLFDLQVE